MGLFSKITNSAKSVAKKVTNTAASTAKIVVAEAKNTATDAAEGLGEVIVQGGSAIADGFEALGDKVFENLKLKALGVIGDINVEEYREEVTEKINAFINENEALLSEIHHRVKALTSSGESPEVREMKMLVKEDESGPEIERSMTRLEQALDQNAATQYESTEELTANFRTETMQNAESPSMKILCWSYQFVWESNAYLGGTLASGFAVDYARTEAPFVLYGAELDIGAQMGISVGNAIGFWFRRPDELKGFGAALVVSLGAIGPGIGSGFTFYFDMTEGGERFLMGFTVTPSVGTPGFELAIGPGFSYGYRP